ncbi:MAG: prepilin-type N-terminal cleavage/methylation domain-containing protein [Geothrix sp.]|nr:prepilin-type N-terminal cleavage/methylation domain-containing protein [Geothrix sp.]
MRTPRRNDGRWQRQAGFSMVEMLMTAFIMAIGILGLSLLQVMSLQASRGSRSLSTAVLVGEDVMDRAEMEGRLSWLNITDTNLATPSLADLPTLKYVTLLPAAAVVETFNIKGGAPNPASLDPAEQTPFFTTTTRRVPLLAATTGRLSDISVQVQFTDQVDPANTPILRTVTLTRRIAHG